MYLSPEDIEAALNDVPEINRSQHRARIKRLAERAQPGNVPFWILVNQYGMQFDWSPADVGEAPKGAD